MLKKIRRYLQKNILPYILQLIVRFIYLTNKKTFYYPQNLDKTKTFIIAMWHGDLLMQPLNYRKLKPDGTIKVIVSEHADGETIKKVVDYLGVGSIIGSSTRGGAKALISAIKNLKQNIDVAITPDGPKGPIYSIADGIVVLAQKTSAPIVVLSSIPTKYWQFRSWDKFIVPKPFGEINFYASEPFCVDNLSLEEAKKVILDKMQQNQLEKSIEEKI